MTAESPEKITDTIPLSVIRVLVEVLPKCYSKSDMNRVFTRISKIEHFCSAYDDPKDSLYEWFDKVNEQDKPGPLDVLGELLNDFWHLEELHNNVSPEFYDDDKNRIQIRLLRSGLSYSEAEGCIIKKNEAPSTRALRDHVEQHDLSNLDRRIQESLDNIEKNPLSAVLHASTTLESVLKEYLKTRQIPYNKDNATLPKLWNIFLENNQKIKELTKGDSQKSEELTKSDLQKIASGFCEIIKGTANLRNKKSNAHGKSEEESRTIKISPRHARLAIHAVHTLSAYILELGEDQKKRDS